MKFRTLLNLITVIVVFFALFASPSFAQSESLDRTYLSRLSSNGNIDEGFGDRGDVFLLEPHFRVGDSIRDSEGRLIVVGNLKPVEGVIDTVVVIRFLEDGRRDLSFGNEGTGRRTLHLVSSNQVSITCMAIDSQNRIIIGGNLTSLDQRSGLLIRLHENGSNDSSFRDGILRFSAEGKLQDTTIQDLAVDGIGRVHTIGTVNRENNHRLAVVSRHLENGERDPSFGSSPNEGWERIEFQGYPESTGLGIGVDGFGRIIAAGTLLKHTEDGGERSNNWLACIRPDGQFDPTFGVEGITITNLGEDTIMAFTAFAMKGRELYCGGEIRSDTYGSGNFVLKYNLLGELVPVFGSNGVEVFQLIPGGYHNEVECIVPLNAGKLLVGIHHRSNSPAAEQHLVAQLTSSGDLDPNFGSGKGYVIRPHPIEVRIGYPMKLLAGSTHIWQIGSGEIRQSLGGAHQLPNLSVSLDWQVVNLEVLLSNAQGWADGIANLFDGQVKVPRIDVYDNSRIRREVPTLHTLLEEGAPTGIQSRNMAFNLAPVDPLTGLSDQVEFVVDDLAIDPWPGASIGFVNSGIGFLGSSISDFLLSWVTSFLGVSPEVPIPGAPLDLGTCPLADNGFDSIGDCFMSGGDTVFCLPLTHNPETWQEVFEGKSCYETAVERINQEFGYDLVVPRTNLPGRLSSGQTIVVYGAGMVPKHIGPRLQILEDGVPKMKVDDFDGAVMQLRGGKRIFLSLSTNSKRNSNNTAGHGNGMIIVEVAEGESVDGIEIEFLHRWYGASIKNSANDPSKFGFTLKQGIHDGAKFSAEVSETSKYKMKAIASAKEVSLLDLEYFHGVRYGGFNAYVEAGFAMAEITVKDSQTTEAIYLFAFDTFDWSHSILPSAVVPSMEPPTAPPSFPLPGVDN